MKLKTRILSLAVFGLSMAATSAHAETAVSMTVSNISEADASIVVTVFDSKKSWLKKPVQTHVVELTDIDDGTAVIDFTLPAGAYAFQVYHDVDGNEKLKTNFIGIPKEPVGVSNDAKGKFGPPKFKDAAINVDGDTTDILIKLTKI